jgi:enoyl-CoA hydratase/carnithine racemase
MKSYQDISYEVDGVSAVITLNRPQQLNAFTFQTLAEIKSAVWAAAADKHVVGIIITGNGRGFSAGLDMEALAAATAPDADTDSNPSPASGQALPGIFSYLLTVPKPVIAAINGVTAGGGFILALMSDLRFASENAMLTTVFLKRGLIAEHGSSWLLPRLVGLSNALDLLWMSDKIDARQAKQLGLVDRVVVPDQLLNEAKSYLQRLSEVSAPKAIGATKRLVYDHLGQNYVDALHDAERVQNEFVRTADAAEGARAFMERRPPVFEPVGIDPDN